jgi:transposase
MAENNFESTNGAGFLEQVNQPLDIGYKGYTDIPPRHLTTDEEWLLVRPAVLCLAGIDGGPRKPGREQSVPLRLIFDAILWLAKTGVPWRDLHPYFGPWKTVYYHFNKWSKRKDMKVLLLEARKAFKAANCGAGGPTQMISDGTLIRAHKAAAGAVGSPAGEPEDHALGRSCGGFGTKVYASVDEDGLPTSVVLAPGQTHDSMLYWDGTREHEEAVGGPAEMGLLDKGFDNDRIRESMRAKGQVAVIPWKKTGW